RSSGVPPRKRVAPDARSPAARRKLIYLTRRAISTWSHRMFRLSRATGSTALYLRWARVATLLYHALTYHRGPLGQIVRRLGLR
ncbi:hypothetical protein SNE32_11200, partial [Lysobacter sp. D1-1-M9]